MKRFSILFTVLFLVFLQTEIGFSGKGRGGPGTTGGNGGNPIDLEGPLNDNISDSGILFGDLYKILRYRGGETKKVPRFNSDGSPVFDASGQQVWDTAIAIGGEPVLTENFAVYTIINEDTGLPEINDDTGDIYFIAPTPSQCTQPVASYLRWGDISAKTGLSNNRIPLTMIYDPTWGRTECEVGVGTINPETGIMEVDSVFLSIGEMWEDPVNGEVTYLNGVTWDEMIQEVSFGRLNIGRAPEAVLQAAFDEAINSINSAIAIEIDASGRILLTRQIFSEFEVDPETGSPLLLDEPVVKAIDSPLENLALYVKLLKDGHLVTAADERIPLDRSENGGIPIWKMIELEDGPSQALRPTIDIEKLREWGLGQLVNVTEVEYYTYFDITYDAECTAQSRVLLPIDSCSNFPITDECGTVIECTGPWTGILTDDGGEPYADDMPFAASFFSAAADKTGFISVDMIVYLNSILGINKVVGYSETDEDGNPTADAINYYLFPEYFNFDAVTNYGRGKTFTNRGEVYQTGGNGQPSEYSGSVLVLQPGSDGFTWLEHEVSILGTIDFPAVELVLNPDTPELDVKGVYGSNDIYGFSQMAEDDLSVIGFIHTYQIPERR